MAIEVNEIRAAWIWVEAFDTIDATPCGEPLASLATKAGYEKLFDNARARQGGLQPPWEPAVNRFWRFYLGNRTPANVTAKRAWRYIVPLRQRLPASVETPGISHPSRAFFEVFYFPHAIAVVASVRLVADMSLFHSVDSARAVLKDTRYGVTWKGAAKRDDLVLSALAGQALDRLRAQSLGPVASQGDRPDEPFSIVAVIRAKGVDETGKLAEDGEIHRALEGYCSWHDTFRKDDLTPLADAAVQIRQSAPDADFLFGTNRGRAVWFPGQFHPKPGKRPLACYFRNLVFASLQTEGLGALIRLSGKRIDDNQPLSRAAVSVAGYASDALYRFYHLPERKGDPKEKTYRSHSPRRQIVDSGLIGSLKTVRHYLGRQVL